MLELSMDGLGGSALAGFSHVLGSANAWTKPVDDQETGGTFGPERTDARGIVPPWLETVGAASIAERRYRFRACAAKHRDDGNMNTSRKAAHAPIGLPSDRAQNGITCL